MGADVCTNEWVSLEGKLPGKKHPESERQLAREFKKALEK